MDVASRLQAGQSGVRIQVWTRNLALFQKVFTDSGAKTAPPPIQREKVSLPGIKQPRREANHLSPSSPEIKIEWSHTSTALMPL